MKMGLFSFFADLRGATLELRRIADALDRAYPIPAEGEGELTVSYHDAKRAALEDYVAHLKEIGELPPDAELPEEENVSSSRD